MSNLHRAHADSSGSPVGSSDQNGLLFPGSTARYTPEGDYRGAIGYEGSPPSAGITDLGYKGKTLVRPDLSYPWYKTPGVKSGAGVSDPKSTLSSGAGAGGQ